MSVFSSSFKENLSEDMDSSSVPFISSFLNNYRAQGLDTSLTNTGSNDRNVGSTEKEAFVPAILYPTTNSFMVVDSYSFSSCASRV